MAKAKVDNEYGSICYHKNPNVENISPEDGVMVPYFLQQTGPTTHERLNIYLPYCNFQDWYHKAISRFRDSQACEGYKSSKSL